MEIIVAAGTWLVSTVGAAIGGEVGAFLMMNAVAVGTVLSWATVIGFGVNQASRARRKARDAYNASLRDRLVMTATTDGPRSRIYGRCRNVDGVLWKGTHGDKSQYYTLVVAVAGHEVDAIETVYFNDEPLSLDADGWVLTSPWSGSGRTAVEYYDVPPGVTVVTLPYVPLEVKASTWVQDGVGQEVACSVVGSTVTLAGDASEVSRQIVYKRAVGSAKARVRKYLGTAGQDLSGVLSPTFPSQITSAHKFRGIALLLVDLEYDQDAFPTGLPNITAVVRGAKVYDPRDGVTRWTQNPALIARDWALYSQGGAAGASEIHDIVAQANACDVTHGFVLRKVDGSTVTTVRPMYQCDIVARTDAAPDDVLSAIVESMAGRWAWDGGKLRIKAGAYTAPVATLTEDWVSDKGDIEIVSGVSRTEMVNVYKPTIADAEQHWVVAPTAQVRADAYISTDGQELVREISLEAVTHADQAQHVCGVMLRDLRQGLTARIPCNMLAYPVEVFDTIAVTLPRFGWSAKPMMVLAWEFSQMGGVVLTLKETDASIYDPDAEFTAADAAPNTALPNPFSVPALGTITLSSGGTELLKLGDGTVISRLKASWPAVQDEAVRNAGSIELRWGASGVHPDKWQTTIVPGDATQAHLTPVRDGEVYTVIGRARNRLVAGPFGALAMHVVIGKTGAPAAPVDVVVSPTIGGALIGWRPSPDIDYAETELRVGTDLESSELLWRGAASGYNWATPTGEYLLWLRHYDAWGNGSLWTEYAVSVTEGGVQPGLMLDIGATSFVVPASAAGVVSSYAGAVAGIRVLSGSTDDTAAWTLGRTNGAGVSSTLAAGMLTLTALADATDASYIDVSATRTGFATLTRRLPVSKTKAGATGAAGATGPQGPTGPAGSNGANGTRTADVRVFK